MKKTEKTSIRIDSRAYNYTMAFFCVYSIYFILLSIGMAAYDNTGEIIVPLLLTQSIAFVIAVIMLACWIRYRIKSGIGIHPLKYLKGRLLWMRNFLFPFKYLCHPAPEEDDPVTKLIYGFDRGYSAFFRGKDLDEHVTQMYRHHLKAHKKRLDHLGIVMEENWSQMQYKEEPAIRAAAYKDGKLKRIQASSHIRGSRTYSLKGTQIHQIQGIYGADYDFVGMMTAKSAADNRSFICPNCGAVSKGSELISGCPYCGTAFHIEELSDRVCNYSVFRDPFFDRILAGLKINGHLNRLSFLFALGGVAGAVQMLNEMFLKGGESTAMLPFMLLLLSLSVLLMFFAFLGVIYVLTIPVRLIANKIYKAAQERRSEELKVMEENRKKLRLIHKVDPDFSLESFLSNVRNKAASIHYAGSGKEMEVLSLTDLSDKVPVYKDVFDCRFGPVSIEDYAVNGEWRSAELILKMNLLKLDGNKAVEVPEKIRMKVSRNTGQPSKNPFGIHSVYCPSCGHSIDLMEGNICKYCGSKWDLREYDWCIREYEVL